MDLRRDALWKQKGFGPVENVWYLLRGHKLRLNSVTISAYFFWRNRGTRIFLLSGWSMEVWERQVTIHFET